MQKKSASNGAVVLGLSTSQYVSYDKGSNANVIITGLTDQKIYRVNSISYDKTTQKAKVKLKELTQVMTGGLSHDPGASQTAISLTAGSDSTCKRTFTYNSCSICTTCCFKYLIWYK